MHAVEGVASHVVGAGSGPGMQDDRVNAVRP